ncbi:hypothetical protein [Amycolatopsis sp. NPDC049868]|uniref:hypothetical protein n=1 Tax=Amycolatopsis sp. NPDC049868 TaxID=3363934 RepID=UPI0037BBC3E7
MFLIVVLVDDDGCLTGLYERIVETFGHRHGHWAFAKTVADLQSSASKWLGRAAMRRPRWERIVDLVAIGVPAALRDEVLAIAAGLYCDAARRDHPGGEYRGEIRRPSWNTLPTVSATTIRKSMGRDDERVEGAHRTEPAPDEPPPRFHGDLRDEVFRLTEELEETSKRLAGVEVVLDNQIRDWRRLQAENDFLRALKTADDERLRQQFIESTNLRQQHYEVSVEKHAVIDFCMAMLKSLHPNASEGTLRKLIDDHIEAAFPRAHSRGTAVEFLHPNPAESAKDRTRPLQVEAERRRNNADARNLAERLNAFYS